LNTELRATGGKALQVLVALTASLLGLPEVLLRVWWEHDGLLICAANSDGAVALGIALMTST